MNKRSKRITWNSLHSEKTEPTFNNPNPTPIPTIRGYRYDIDENPNIRLFQYSSGDWGIQVTTQLSSRAKTEKAAKRKAAEILKAMTEKRVK